METPSTCHTASTNPIRLHNIEFCFFCKPHFSQNSTFWNRAKKINKIESLEQMRLANEICKLYELMATDNGHFAPL